MEASAIEGGQIFELQRHTAILLLSALPCSAIGRRERDLPAQRAVCTIAQEGIAVLIDTAAQSECDQTRSVCLRLWDPGSARSAGTGRCVWMSVYSECRKRVRQYVVIFVVSHIPQFGKSLFGI